VDQRRVTLIMPVYNEAADIGDVLRSLDAQTFAHEALYAVIVDGGSTDGTCEAIQTWLERGDIPGELVRNPRRTIPTSLNAGVEHARPGTIVVRLDGHTTYAPDYVESIVAEFTQTPAAVGCVGGPQVPRPESRFDLALVVALYTNPLGLGGAGFRQITEPRDVNGVYLGAWRPGVLEEAGGFDERWEANEDAELAARVRHAGYRIRLIAAHSAYRVKRGPLAVVRQWGRYGYWRAQTLRRHPGELRLRHLAPPVALLLALVFLLSPLRPLVALGFAAYAAAIWAKRSAGEDPRVTLAACVFFPACQAAWGLGLARGFLARATAPTRARRRPAAPRLDAGV